MYASRDTASASPVASNLRGCGATTSGAGLPLWGERAGGCMREGVAGNDDAAECGLAGYVVEHAPFEACDDEARRVENQSRATSCGSWRFVRVVNTSR